MLAVLCVSIFLLVIGALCRAGIKRKKRNELNKRGANDVEANRMAVEIIDIREPFDGQPVRRMSIGQDDVVKSGLMGCFRQYPRLKEPRQRSDVERRMVGPEEREDEIQRREERADESEPDENYLMLPANSEQQQQHRQHSYQKRQVPQENRQLPAATTNVNIFVNHASGKTSLNNHKTASMDDDLAPSTPEGVPDPNQPWIRLLRQPRIREHLVTSIDPERLIEHMPDVLEREHEEWVKQTREREGNTRACRRLLELVESSANKDWPMILIAALEDTGYTNQAALLKTTYEEAYSEWDDRVANTDQDDSNNTKNSQHSPSTASNNDLTSELPTSEADMDDSGSSVVLNCPGKETIV